MVNSTGHCVVVFYNEVGVGVPGVITTRGCGGVGARQGEGGDVGCRCTR